MKFLVAFIQQEDTPTVLRRLREEHVAVTATESEGGFLRRKNTTLFLALSDEQLDGILAIIRDVCRSRTERVDTTFATGAIESLGLPGTTAIPVGGATVVIVNAVDVLKI